MTAHTTNTKQHENNNGFSKNSPEKRDKMQITSASPGEFSFYSALKNGAKKGKRVTGNDLSQPGTVSTASWGSTEALNFTG